MRQSVGWMTPPEGEAQKTSPLTSSQFVLSLAGKTQSPQLLSAVDNPPLRCVIICGGFWSIGLSTLARLEHSLSAGTICAFMLGHRDRTP
jgi:hypothetical protein